MGNELAIEVREADERADLFDHGGNGPGENAIDFDGVHDQLSGANNDAEELYLLSVKEALLRFKVEFVFL